MNKKMQMKKLNRNRNGKRKYRLKEWATVQIWMQFDLDSDIRDEIIWMKMTFAAGSKERRMGRGGDSTVLQAVFEERRP